MENKGEQRRTKVTFGKKLLWLQVMLISEKKNKSVAKAIIDLH